MTGLDLDPDPVVDPDPDLVVDPDLVQTGSSETRPLCTTWF